MAGGAVRSAAALAALLSLALAPVGCIDLEDKARHKADWISTDELLYLTNSSRAAALSQPLAAVFVAFSTPWCTSCESTTTPLWDELSEEYDYFDDTRVVVVDCSGPGADACALLGILTYPTLMALGGPAPLLDVLTHPTESTVALAAGPAAVPGTGDDAKTGPFLFGAAETYTGAWELDLLKRFVEARVPSLAVPRGERAIAPLLDRSGEVLCAGWRATDNCDPEGDRVPAKDLNCRQEVLGKRAGYCECGEASAGAGEADAEGGALAQGDDDECDSEHEECSSKLPSNARNPVECGEAYRKAFTCAEECAPIKDSSCVSWRATGRCTSKGHKDTRGDRDCRTLITSGDSGFCECATHQTAHTNCTDAGTREPFTCEEMCHISTAAEKAKEAAAEERVRLKRALKAANRKASKGKW